MRPISRNKEEKKRKETEESIVCYTAVFRVVTQCSSSLRGGFRDDNKNGCVAD